LALTTEDVPLEYLLQVQVEPVTKLTRSPNHIRRKRRPARGPWGLHHRRRIPRSMVNASLPIAPLDIPSIDPEGPFLGLLRYKSITALVQFLIRNWNPKEQDRSTPLGTMITKARRDHPEDSDAQCSDLEQRITILNEECNATGQTLPLYSTDNLHNFHHHELSELCDLSRIHFNGEVLFMPEGSPSTFYARTRTISMGGHRVPVNDWLVCGDDEDKVFYSQGEHIHRVHSVDEIPEHVAEDLDKHGTLLSSLDPSLVPRFEMEPIAVLKIPTDKSFRSGKKLDMQDPPEDLPASFLLPSICVPALSRGGFPVIDDPKILGSILGHCFDNIYNPSNPHSNLLKKLQGYWVLALPVP